MVLSITNPPLGLPISELPKLSAPIEELKMRTTSLPPGEFLAELTKLQKQISRYAIERNAKSEAAEAIAAAETPEEIEQAKKAMRDKITTQLKEQGISTSVLEDAVSEYQRSVARDEEYAKKRLAIRASREGLSGLPLHGGFGMKSKAHFLHDLNPAYYSVEFYHKESQVVNGATLPDDVTGVPVCLSGTDIVTEPAIKGITAIKIDSALTPGRKELTVFYSEGSEHHSVRAPFAILKKPDVTSFEDDARTSHVGQPLKKGTEMTLKGTDLQNLSHIEVVGKDDTDAFRLNTLALELSDDNAEITFTVPRTLKENVSEVRFEMKHDLAKVDSLP